MKENKHNYSAKNTERQQSREDADSLEALVAFNDLIWDMVGQYGAAGKISTHEDLHQIEASSSDGLLNLVVTIKGDGDLDSSGNALAMIERMPGRSRYLSLVATDGAVEAYFTPDAARIDAGQLPFTAEDVDDLRELMLESSILASPSSDES